MPTIAQALKPALTGIHEQLETARQQLEHLEPAAFEDVVPELDRMLRDLRPEVDGCRRYISLRQAASPQAYNPAELLKSQSGLRPADPARVVPEAAPDLEGDPKQILAALRTILLNANLRSGAELTAALYFEGEGPRYTVGIQGEGSLPDTFQFGTGLTLASGELDVCWRAATRGGTLTHEGSLMTLLLEGDAAFTEGEQDWEPVIKALDRAVRALQPWRTAIGMYEGGLVGDADALKLYQQAVDRVLEQIGEAMTVTNSRAASSI